MRAGLIVAGILTAVGAVQTASTGQTPMLTADPSSLVRVEFQIERPVVQAGREVWAQFMVTNLTDEPVTLRVPEAKEAESSSLMGLPLPHVFSGVNWSALAIINQHGDPFDEQTSMPPRGPVPKVVIAPHASVGTRVELTHYYESLKRPGEYTLLWRPYHGQVLSQPVNLRVLAERQAVILTEFGKMTLRFYYNEAPNHVASFIELVQMKFYDNLTFNRVIPGALIQGGDPRGDRRGIRPDGKRLKAEFNKIPFDLGTVGMARSPRDPDSASCQFFICLGRQPGFDGQQTAFGYLVGDESIETLRKIAAVPTDSDDKPKQPVYIRAITLESVPVKESPIANPRPASQPADSQDAIHVTTRSAMSGTEREISVRFGPPPILNRHPASPADSQPAAPTGQ